MSSNDLNTNRKQPPSQKRRRLLIGGLAGGALVGAETIGVLWWSYFFNLTHPPTYSSTLYTYAGHPSGVSSVAWSPDGTRIASVGWMDHTIQVWNARDGQRLLTYRGHPDVYRVAWSPDSTHLASAGLTFTVQIWNASTGQQVWSDQESAESGSEALIAWSPDGRQIATSGSASNGAIDIRDARDGHLLLSYQGHPFPSSLAWSPDSTRIASGGWDRSVQAWRALDGQKIWLYPDQEDINHVDAIAWSPDGAHIVSGGSCPIILFASNGGIQMWKASTGQKSWTYWGHDERSDIRAVSWSPNGKQIASGATDKTVQVWSASDGKRILTYNGHTDNIEAVAWSPDGTRIASAGRDRFVRVWQVF